eukprot:GHVQ01008980.1.p1 GENE.GHVQ01008980.1~~GHVQ01008980.1.p1  ORF type:complete len:296 (+),score=33.13 GHVQ01008980.1:479-1366(+)
MPVLINSSATVCSPRIHLSPPVSTMSNTSTTAASITCLSRWLTSRLLYYHRLISPLFGGLWMLVSVVTGSRRLVLCGVVQTVFEASMYVFVFFWTPSLPDGVNHGLVFAGFMAAVMTGAGVFNQIRFSHGIPLPVILSAVFALGCITFLITSGLSLSLNAIASLPLIFSPYSYTISFPCLSSSSLDDIHDGVPDCASLPGVASQRFICFLVFECLCGIYFPAYHTLRSQVVPSQSRGTILSLFRVPMNVLVLAVCYNAQRLKVEYMMLICSVWLGIGAVASAGLMWTVPSELRWA